MKRNNTMDVVGDSIKAGRKSAGLMRLDIPVSARSSNQVFEDALSSRSRTSTRSCKPVLEKGIFSHRKTTPTIRESSENTLAVKSKTASVSVSLLKTSVSTTSKCSVKPLGHIPVYLGRKNDKAGISSSIVNRKRILTAQKKKLAEYQKEVLETHKNLTDLQKKLNKMDGKDEMHKVVDLKLISFGDGPNENFTELPPQSASRQNETGLVHGKQKKLEYSFDELKIISDGTLWKAIEDKITVVDVVGFQLVQEFVNLYSKHFKSASAGQPEESGDTNVFPTELENALSELEAKVIAEREEQDKRKEELMSELKAMLITDKGEPVLLKESLKDEYDKFKKAHDEHVTDMKAKIKHLETELSHKEQELKDVAVKMTQIVSTKMDADEMLDIRTKLLAKETECDQATAKCKAWEARYKKIEHRIDELMRDLATKEREIHAIKGQLKTAADRIAKVTTEEKLHEQKFSKFDKDARVKIEQLQSSIAAEQKLRAAAEKKLAEAKVMLQKVKVDNDDIISLDGNAKTLENDVKILRLELEKNDWEKKGLKKNLADIQKQNDDLQLVIKGRNKEIKEKNEFISQLTTEFEKSKIIMDDNNALICDLQDQIQTLNTTPPEIESEMRNLQQSLADKVDEIEYLKLELLSANSALKEQDDVLFLHDSILNLRTDLINSLEDREASTKTQLIAMHAKVENKSKLVDQVMLNKEVAAQAEELQNLFSTLGHKQMEVNRQDRIIQMLEEANEKNQQLRMKQERKIAKLTRENEELKQHHMPESYKELKTIYHSASPNLDFYETERRSKRKTKQEISVKKYSL